MGFETACVAQAALGECPLWSVREQALYWVDIEAPSLNRFDPATGENTSIPMDENIGCIGFRAGGGFVAGMRSGVWLLDGAGRKERLLATPQPDTSISRFNDGRVDPWGRFWAGTIHEPRDRAGGALYVIGADGSCRAVGKPVRTSNGVAFSPDARTAYHSDTPAHVIYRYALDADGAVTDAGIFAEFEHGAGRPDGAAVDAEGCYWTALFEGGRVAKLSPEGAVLAEFPVPARCPTMCAFGGADLRTLYVTSARHKRPADELAEWPESGNLFAMRTDVPGRPEPEFAG